MHIQNQYPYGQCQTLSVLAQKDDHREVKSSLEHRDHLFAIAANCRLTTINIEDFL
jgi:hypothetical protein